MANLRAEEILEQLLQHAPKMNAPVAEVGRRILEKLERAEGQFRAADLELNRLKVELGQEKMAREDADCRFAESAMAHSRANLRVEQLEAALRDARTACGCATLVPPPATPCEPCAIIAVVLDGAA